MKPISTEENEVVDFPVYTRMQTLYICWRDTGKYKRVYAGSRRDVARRMIAIAATYNTSVECFKVEICPN